MTIFHICTLYLKKFVIIDLLKTIQNCCYNFMVITHRPKWCSGYDDRLLTQRFRVRIPGKVSSGLGGRLSLTLINRRE
jgi:hypothetical protein